MDSALCRKNSRMYQKQCSGLLIFLVSLKGILLILPFFNLRYEADHVRQCILQKKTESDRVSHKTSKRVLSLLEEMISQVKSRTKGEGIEQTL